MTTRTVSKASWIYTVVSLLMVCVFLFPIYWMVATAVKPATEIFANPPKLIPTNVDFTVWQTRIFENPRVLRYFVNSLILGFGTTFLTLALAAPASYGIAKLPIRGKSFLLSISLVSLMFPAIMLALPFFVMFSRIGLTDSYAGLILANTALALPFAIIVLRPFFLAIPNELTAAAQIDGCTPFGAFVRVVLPLATPGLFTAAVFTFLFGWSDLVFALSLTTEESMRPVTAGLWNFIGSNVTQWNAVMAFSTLAMLPPLAVFLVAQRYVVAGLTAGAVKE
ncbi:ABC transporter permease subunit [Rubrobacter tropicus]|uniref:ABC transporter permease subunit n=1 Tax=Rubrobacter tropicus TaxID=2653851 RepID=A0A6G8Q635_9ACTN|nr:carbohydrate ABC transporter permease [Rubrobacter tropicus]QIN81954.1 ABC transporter permease subunit [Rubrobacter tropicus]